MSLLCPLVSLSPGCIGIGPKRKIYVSHLRASGTALAECERMVSAGVLAAAFAKLGGVLIDAARAAGCKHVSGSRPSRGMRRDKPYFDQECRRMRAQFRYAMRHDPESVRYWHGVSPPPFAGNAASIGNSRLQLSCATCAVTTSALCKSSIQLGVLCLLPWTA